MGVGVFYGYRENVYLDRTSLGILGDNLTSSDLGASPPPL